MSVFKRRTRIISFRVSEEEYGHLLRISSESGAHSISDWARAVTCAHCGCEVRGPNRAHDLNARVDELHREVQRLSDLIGNHRAN